MNITSIVLVCLLLWLISFTLIIKRTNLVAPLKYVWAIMIYPMVLLISILSAFVIDITGSYFEKLNNYELLTIYIYPLTTLFVIPFSFILFYIIKKTLFKSVKGNTQYFIANRGILNYLLLEIPELTINENKLPYFQLTKHLALPMARFFESILSMLVMLSIASSLLIFFKLKNYGI